MKCKKLETRWLSNATDAGANSRSQKGWGYECQKLLFHIFGVSCSVVWYICVWGSWTSHTCVSGQCGVRRWGSKVEMRRIFKEKWGRFERRGFKEKFQEGRICQEEWGSGRICQKWRWGRHSRIHQLNWTDQTGCEKWIRGGGFEILNPHREK